MTAVADLPRLVRQRDSHTGILLPADPRCVRNDEWIVADLDAFETLAEVV